MVEIGNLNINITPENVVSFGAGVTVGWATAYIMYRNRGILGGVRDSVSSQASSAQEFAKRGADARYVRDLIKHIEVDHLVGKKVPLSEIVVEPRFLPAPDLEEPPDDDVVRSVFHVVPKIHDHPYLYAPYNVPVLSIEELGKGHNSIALLGLTGSGRTTALYAIALWSLGAVVFEKPVDKVEQRLEEEEASLDNNEKRAELIRERLNVEQMALQNLSKRKGEDIDDADDVLNSGRDFRRLTPFYAHMANINVSAREFGRRIDPAEPLLRAVQQHTTRITARTLAGNFYQRLNEGNALLLIDGFDDLPDSERPQKLAWLKAFLDEYDHNFTIVTGPAVGYGKLMQAGLSPVFLRAWSDVNTDMLASRWADAWPKIHGRRGSNLDERTLAYAKARNRARNPFDLSIKMWKTYDSQDSSTYHERIDNLMTRFVSAKQLEADLPKLIAAATLQLDEGYITAKRLEKVMTGIDADIDDMDDDDDELFSDVVTDDEDDDALFSDVLTDDDLQADDGDYDDETDELDELSLDDLPDDDLPDEDLPDAIVQKDSKKAKSKKKEEKVGKEYIQFVDNLYNSGLLVRYKGGRYQFRNNLITAYFAGMGLKDVAKDVLVERSFSPKWQNSIAYAALHMPIDDIVEARLTAPEDVLHTNVLDLAHWLAHADENVEWRKPLFSALGKMFVAQNQYLLIRERIASALVSSRDKNALIIFRKALNHPYPEVRQLACLGLGAMRDEDAKVIDRLARLLGDEETDVTLTAGLALGAIGTEDAYDVLIEELQEGEENLRQAVAEAFAAIPEVGWTILFDAAHHEDMMIRRAALFGLRRINTSWSLIALYRRSIEDPEWYVKSAAEEAFLDMQYGNRASGVKPYPKVEDIPWVREWLSEMGQIAGQLVQAGPSAILRKALDEGDLLQQALSVANMGQLGMVSNVEAMYLSLRHRDDIMRETALRALANIQLQIGDLLPNPA